MTNENYILVGITTDKECSCAICGKRMDEVKSMLLLSSGDNPENPVGGKLTTGKLYAAVCSEHVGPGKLGTVVEVTY
jgi:hypothetical protein